MMINELESHAFFITKFGLVIIEIGKDHDIIYN